MPLLRPLRPHSINIEKHTHSTKKLIGPFMAHPPEEKGRATAGCAALTPA